MPTVSVYILDLLVIGLLLLTVALASGWIARLPLSYALIYLVVGLMLGPYGFNLVQLEPEANFIERLTEFVVIVSLYSCGLRMNRPFRLRAWSSTVRLIGVLMPISIFAVAAIAHWALELNWGASILLGAILAPTDPVLASEVQIESEHDRDELRFGLTSEGGLNDALAFPFVYFGLHWIEHNGWGSWVGQWVAIDLVWAIAAGLVMGIVLARGVVWVSQRLRKLNDVSEEMEDLVSLGTILLVYSLTEVVNGYGFLAVFVAGVVVRRCFPDGERLRSQLRFTGYIERLLEIGTILLLGTLLRVEPLLTYGDEALFIVGSLLFVVRPLGAWISTLRMKHTSPRTRLHPATRLLFGWFGIRGVGSLYYLSYAFGHDLSASVTTKLAWITYITVIISVVLHGISATPLMRWYERYIGKSPAV